MRTCHSSETENNDSVNFIGVNITHSPPDNMHNNLHGYFTSVYIKPTSTPLFTNYNSFTPINYRLSVFKCSIHRAYLLCSSWSVFHAEICNRQEICNILSMLVRNDYTSWVLDRLIKCSVANFMHPIVKCGP